MTIRHCLTGAACAIGLTIFAAWGQPVHDGDIILGQDGAEIVTGTFDDDSGETMFDACVYGMDLSSDTKNNDPGFDSGEGVFPPFDLMGPNIRKALRVWENGNFDTIPDEKVEISWGPLGPIVTPDTDEIVDGSDIGLGVSATGQFHNHYIFELTAPAETGVYLLELEFWLDPATYATSRPFWIVIDRNADAAEFEEAVQHVRDTIAWCTSSCAADFNGDTVVDTKDVLDFLNAFVAGDPAADFNGDTSIDTKDVLAFLNAFTQGC